MIQRMKALEQSLIDGSWSTARWYELIPTGESHLTSRAEARAAAKQEKDEQLMKSHKKPPAAAKAE